MSAPTYFTETVILTGTTRAGAPIERCHSEFKETWLLMPGTGVHFLVDRTRIEPPARRSDAQGTREQGAPA